MREDINELVFLHLGKLKQRLGISETMVADRTWCSLNTVLAVSAETVTASYLSTIIAVQHPVYEKDVIADETTSRDGRAAPVGAHVLEKWVFYVGDYDIARKVWILREYEVIGLHRFDVEDPERGHYFIRDNDGKYKSNVEV